MKSIFSSEFFAANRQRLRELFTGTAPIVVTANGLLQRGSIDNAYAFFQDASFWYLTGIEEPDIVLVMDKDKEYLIVPARSASRQAFDGAVSAEALTRRSGITEVLDEKAGWQRLGSRVKRVKHIAALRALPDYVEQYGIYANPARANMIAKLKTHNPNVELLDLHQHLARLRMIKQPEELAAMQAATDITIAAFKDATRPVKLQKYAREYEIEAELTRGFRRRGASGHSFDPIVAGGKRACTLHNVANSGSLDPWELVIIDIGAEVEHYAADITRTINIKPPTRRQRAVHAAVLDVQRFALELLGPGVVLKEYEQQVRHFMGEKLRELGLIKTIDHDSIHTYYPHGTSHFIGLNVHDIGEYDRPLEPGVVVSCEPGIYIPEEGIGVRIEDDVLITSRGNKVLSRKLPKDLTA